VMVDLIVQNLAERGTADLSFTVPRQDLERTLLLVREVTAQWPQSTIAFEKNIAILSVIGIGLRSHTGVGQQMFTALAEAGVNVQMVTTSEIRTSVVVTPEHGPAAHAALIRAFGLAN
jgi:aspartate kinase